jgi:DNA-directed RNA polymerase specialized sigma24 family protein
MNKHPLNELYSQFIDRIISREELEGAIYQYYTKNREKAGFSLWSDEDYEDFLSTFYPRLQSSINLYRETGASFESFLGTVIHTSAREYRVKKVNNSMTEYSAWSVQVPDMYAREETPVYSYEMRETALSKIMNKDRSIRNPKQLLALVLKCYYYVSDDFIDRFAGCTGMDRKKLKDMIERLRKLRAVKDDNIYKMRERVYGQFYRCMVYEKRLALTTVDTNSYLKLKIKAVKARKRLDSMRERISKIRNEPKNREIAEVIGVSKGAVDSNLYCIRKKWGKKENDK